MDADKGEPTAGHAAPAAPDGAPGVAHAEVLDAFARHLSAERNLSAHTVRAYRGDLANLLGHLERTGEGSLAEGTILCRPGA